MTSKGYPETYTKGLKINILNNPLVFYSGAIKKDAQLLTNGGRVLSVVATGNSITKARENVYKMIKNVRFPDAFYRKDIGL
jgi:phosphoribosylamine--glycine ligase